MTFISSHATIRGMKGTTHLVIGLSAGMAISSSLGMPPKAVPWFALLLGALTPDLDEEGSTISKPSKFLVHLLPKTICDVIDSLMAATSKLTNLLFGHRGMLHWPVVGVVIMALGWRYQIHWLSWFGFGYLTHIISDACTRDGVPLFAPINTAHVGWSPFKTGSWGEKVIVLLCGIYIAWWGFTSLPNAQQEAVRDRVLRGIQTENDRGRTRFAAED